MSLYSELNDIGLFPAHEWPYANADLHRRLITIEEELHTLSSDDYDEAYSKGFNEGEAEGLLDAADEARDEEANRITFELRQALGMEGSLTELLTHCRLLARAQA